MIFSPPLFVLECGARHLSLHHCTRQRHGQVAVATERVDFEPLQRDSDWLAQIGGALRELSARQKRRGGMALVLPAHLTLMKTVSVPRVAADKHLQLVRFEAEHWFPLALDELAWNHFVADTRDNEHEVLLCAVRNELVVSLCQLVDATGFTPLAVFPESTTTLAAFRAVPHGNENAIVIDCGHRSSSFIFANGPSCRLRSVNLGTRDLLAQIERLASDGKSSPGENRATGTAWLASRLGHELKRSNLRADGSTAFPFPLRIFLTGEGVVTEGLADELTRRLSTEVERLESKPSRALAASGAAILVDGRKDATGALDLLPPHWVRRRTAAWRWRRASVITAIVGVALIPLVIHGLLDVRTLQHGHHARLVELQPLRDRMARLKAQMRERDELQQRCDTLTALLDSRDYWARLLAGLETQFAEIPHATLERLANLPSADSDGAASDHPVRLACIVRFAPDDQPPDRQELTRSAARLVAGVATSPFVASVGVPRFTATVEGTLTVEFVLTLRDQGSS